MNEKDYSVLRREQYKFLFKHTFFGEVLDLGGHVKNNYHNQLRGEHVMDIANLDPDSGASMIFDFQETFPIEDESYDNVICLNVLEHVFDYDAVLSETSRVTKKGGHILVSTPFMFRVHGNPDDYFRYTPSALTLILEKNGFCVEEMHELGGGLFSVFAQHISGVFPFIWLRNFFRLLMVSLDKLFVRISPRYAVIAKESALGYFVVARKK